MKNVVIEEYSSFNFRRYSDPWVAIVDDHGKIDFSEKVGAYTGERRTGEEGQLYVFEPKTNQVYAYGQKDYRGHNGGYGYAVFDGEKFVKIAKTEMLKAIANK